MENWENENKTVSVGEWFGTLIVASIPIVGFIAVLIWAFGKGAVKSKRNWAQAMFIIYILGTFIGIIFWTTTFALLSKALFNIF